MKKIRKVDPRLGQSVLAFGCPCAACYLYSCNCSGAEAVSWTIERRNEVNRYNGGSIRGGGG